MDCVLGACSHQLAGTPSIGLRDDRVGMVRAFCSQRAVDVRAPFGNTRLGRLRWRHLTPGQIPIEADRMWVNPFGIPIARIPDASSLRAMLRVVVDKGTFPWASLSQG